MSTLRVLILLTAIVIAAPLSGIAQEPTQPDEAHFGAELFRGCASCHGDNAEGIEAIAAPGLAAQNADYLFLQLENYANGMRGTHSGDPYGSQMGLLAKSAGDEAAWRAVSDYISKLPAQVPERTRDGDVARGKTLYDGCISCHGENGEGVGTVGGPALNGLADWYLIGQISNYLAGARGYHEDDLPGQQMQASAAWLESEDDIVDVSAYIASLGAASSE